jgi:hypothetical protein
MSAQMEPLQGGIILSSNHDATLTEIDSDIGHDQFVDTEVACSLPLALFILFSHLQFVEHLVCGKQRN